MKLPLLTTYHGWVQMLMVVYNKLKLFIHMTIKLRKSMNNYADLCCNTIQYYGLTPNSAENDGQGTAWTHYAIVDS